VRSRRLKPGIDRLTCHWLDLYGQASAGHHDTAEGNLNEMADKMSNLLRSHQQMKAP
jgi:hypothetical protein